MTEKIKNLINSSRSFAVLAEENPEDHEFLAKEILLSAMSEKKLPVVSLPPEDEFLKAKWAPVLKQKKSSFLLQKTSLKLPKEKYEIKEISYAEDSNYISFIITSPSQNLSKNDILIETSPLQVDGAFCFFGNDAKLENFSEKIQLPSREKIIFINQNEKTLVEKIFDIVQIFNPNILTDKEISTLFFAALIKETNNFSERVSGETLSLGSLFIKHGAQKEAVSEIIKKESSAPATQLLGRIMARTYIDDSLDVSWSFLNQRDLQKTGILQPSPSIFYEMIKKMRTLIPSKKLHLLLWSSDEKVRAMAASSSSANENLLFALSQKMQASLSSRFFVTGHFKNFSEAEIALRQKIKEVLFNC